MILLPERRRISSRRRTQQPHMVTKYGFSERLGIDELCMTTMKCLSAEIWKNQRTTARMWLQTIDNEVKQYY